MMPSLPPHRRATAPTLAHVEKTKPHRDSAVTQAHVTGAYSYQRIAEYFGMRFTTVEKIVNRGK